MADSQQGTEVTAGGVQAENDALPTEDITQEVEPKVEIHIEPSEVESNESKSDNGEAQLEKKNDNGEENKLVQPSPKLKRGPPGSPMGSRLQLDKDRIGSNLSVDQRKQNAEELRKKKAGDLKKKEDDKRKAVLERKKKIEQEERKRADALLKKLQVSPKVQPKRPASAPARRTQSTSNLFHLKKMQATSRDIDISGDKSGDKKRNSFSSDRSSPGASAKADRKPRPSSAMERKRPGSFTDSTASSKASSTDSLKTNKTSVRQQSEPRVRQSLGGMTQRPSSSLGVRTRPESQRKSMGPVKATTPIQPLPQKLTRPASAASRPSSTASRPKEMHKSKSASSVLTQKDTKPRPPHKDTRPKQSTSPIEAKTKPPSGTKSKTLNDTKSKVPSSPKPPTKSTSTPKPPKKKSAEKPLPPPMNEDDAKRLLAERRRQAKEEAEKKAMEDQAHREEVERKQAEEAKRLEEEFLVEQQRQNEMIEQLKKDEEKRQLVAQEEKEKKEKEDLEKLEVVKKQREEELNRKKEEELDRRAKEREITRQEEEAERNERKKRIEAIMSKVQRPVTPTFQDDSSERILTTINGDDNSGQISPPGSDSGESAKERADRIIQKMKANGKNGNGSPPEPIISEEKKIIEPVKDYEGNITENKDISCSDEVDNISKTPTSNDIQNCEDLKFNSELAIEDQRALQQLEKEQQQQQFIEGENKDPMIINDHCENTITNGNGNNNIGKGMVGEENVDKEAEEENLWTAAEQAMKESNDSVLNSLEKKGLGPSDENEANKESQLWQVAEGRLELEECF